MNIAEPDSRNLYQLVGTIVKEWDQGAPADTTQVLDRYPELRHHPSIVLDLAYTEYRCRVAAGEKIDLDGFLSRFPEHRSAVANIISADRILSGNPSAVFREYGSRDRTTPGEPARWPTPGQTLGEFHLLRELGRGAFSRVFLALETTAGDRPVAIKFSWRDNGEAHKLGRLNFDGIAPVLSARHDLAEGLSAIIMPYQGSATVEHVLARCYSARASQPAPSRASAIREAIEATAQPGDPVPDRILQGPDLSALSWEEGIAQLAYFFAEALDFLHKRGLFHHDLKPSNILLTPGGRPLLLDFNLSRSTQDSHALFGGTPVYMAPEQIRAYLQENPLPASRSASADLFAFGIILYECLTGRLPFGTPPIQWDPRDIGRWLLARMQEGFEPVRACNAAVPSSLATLVERCLHLNPAHRPANAAQIARQLRPRRGSTRLRVPLAIASLAALLVVTSALALPGHRTQPPFQVGIEQIRAEGMEALEQACQMRTERMAPVARPKLRTAAARFRQVLDLREALDEPRESWQDLFAQGRVMMLLDRSEHALPYLFEAQDGWKKAPQPGIPDPTGPILACRSYCYTRLGNPKMAIYLGDQALAAGFRSPGLLNNLGYTATLMGLEGNPTKYLSEALRKAPDLYQALYRRAFSGFQVVLRQKTPTPSWVMEDLDRAMDILERKQEPRGAETYNLAANISAQATIDLRKALGTTRPNANDPRAAALAKCEQNTREYLAKACFLGLDRERALKSTRFKLALGEWLVPGNLPRSSMKTLPVLSWYLVDPLVGALR